MTAFSLDDKYTLTEGRVAITGVQALVRLPMDQHRRDREAGLRVGAFISGYPGSPLGEYDKQLQRANRLLADHDVVCQPAINEETAATAIYGAQLLERFPHERFDGVVGIWYGKTPGVDRTGDAFRHGNFIGTGKHGGALVLAGDDTACKSSTIPGDSTISLFDLSIPVLYPGDPAEVLDFGLHGIALSRYAGLWTALKIVTNVADGGAVIDLPHPRPPVLPDLDIGGRRFEKQLDMRLLPPYSIELERQIFSERTAAALAYVHANGLDSIRCASPGDRIGLVAAGKPYRDLRLALQLLGLDEAALDRHGIRVLKLGCIAPIEPRRLREFAQGLEEIVVIEDKRGFVETQIRQVLYNLPDRPWLVARRRPPARRCSRCTENSKATTWRAFSAPTWNSACPAPYRPRSWRTCGPAPSPPSWPRSCRPRCPARPTSAAAAPTTRRPSFPRGRTSPAAASAATRWRCGWTGA